jgi:aconitate hydratase
VAYPDTLVGTDSHTTMVNGLGVLGWGVGGIEAEAAMLGQPVSMLIPEVVGFKLTGKMPEGTTATDLVLTSRRCCASTAWSNKFVEFYGSGLDHLPLADRATIANMAPEYGATCGFFPIDNETLSYLRFTGRDEARHRAGRGLCQGARHVARRGLHHAGSTLRHARTRHGHRRSRPRRPEAPAGLRVAGAASSCYKVVCNREHRHLELKRQWPTKVDRRRPRCSQGSDARSQIAPRLGGDRGDHVLHQHLQPLRDDRRRPRRPQGARRGPDPQAVGQDLARARIAGRHGIPGSRQPAGRPLDALGFNLVGYGCTTCIGNSGPLQPEAVQNAINDNDLVACAVLSGNRNFEGRISPAGARQLSCLARRWWWPTPSPATRAST